MLKLSLLGNCKDGAERRRWEKIFHILQLFKNTTKAWEVSTWRICCYHCIEYRARQSAGTKIYSGISLIWQRLVLGSYTFVRMENHIRIRNLCFSSIFWAIRCSNPCQHSESIYFKRTTSKTKKFGGTYHGWKAYPSIVCHRCSSWSSPTLAKPYCQQKSMQIMQYDM